MKLGRPLSRPSAGVMSGCCSSHAQAFSAAARHLREYAAWPGNLPITREKYARFAAQVAVAQLVGWV